MRYRGCGNDGCTGCRESGQCRKDRGKLGQNFLTQRVHTTRFEGGDVLVERIDQDPERQVGFEFRGGSRQHEVAKRVGPSSQLGEEAGLADPEFAPHLQRGRPALTELGKGVIDREELLGAPNKSVWQASHLLRDLLQNISGCCPDVTG